MNYMCTEYIHGAGNQREKKRNTDGKVPTFGHMTH